ncbi:MAG TPA: glycosyltransferase [Candidatus Saccharimonadales bacterium]|jgi:glycosyltransferase involved in cell wall biosynthesis|nr:glycosyltransferase [Candidatus Saccharimonadales bacterium]
MKSKVLLVCSESPYPLVVGGFERLVSDYQSHVFRDYDVYLLVINPAGRMELLHYGEAVPDAAVRSFLLEERFEFSLFIEPGLGDRNQELIGRLTDRIPSFCFVQRHPQPKIDEALFRGIVTHWSDEPRDDVLRLGGSYNPGVFFRRGNGKKEEFIICVARIASQKNQHELVRHYKERIYDTFGLPLYLAGGTQTPAYFRRRVYPYMDGVAVSGTIDPRAPAAPCSWKSAEEVAELYSRARLFVMASPSESFCLSMIEAMACGLTCVVNGNYFGFDEADLRPNVFGPITGKRGHILDTVAAALEQDIRIDASEWAAKYAVDEIGSQLLGFIQSRLQVKRTR